MRKCCPICGIAVLHSCYHDGDAVSSVEMDEETRERLLRGSLESALAEVDMFKNELLGMGIEI